MVETAGPVGSVFFPEGSEAFHAYFIHDISQVQKNLQFWWMLYLRSLQQGQV